jgi:hypothetical protein
LILGRVWSTLKEGDVNLYGLFVAIRTLIFAAPGDVI